MILTAGEGMHVNDGVQSLGCTHVDYSVDKPEAFLSDDGRVIIPDEMAVVDRDADTVQTKGG